MDSWGKKQFQKVLKPLSLPSKAQQKKPTDQSTRWKFWPCSECHKRWTKFWLRSCFERQNRLIGHLSNHCFDWMNWTKIYHDQTRIFCFHSSRRVLSNPSHDHHCHRPLSRQCPHCRRMCSAWVDCTTHELCSPAAVPAIEEFPNWNCSASVWVNLRHPR